MRKDRQKVTPGATPICNAPMRYGAFTHWLMVGFDHGSRPVSGSGPPPDRAGAPLRATGSARRLSSPAQPALQIQDRLLASGGWKIERERGILDEGAGGILVAS